MAKRRAEDTLLHHSPSKRCYRSLCSVDMQLETMPPTAGVSLSPPTLLSLLGSRCRKRPYYFEDPEQKEQEEEAAAAGLCRKATNDGSRKHADNVLKVQTSGSFQDRHSSNAHKKRPREDCSGSEIVIPQANDKAANGDGNTEDCAYNSFQYWRVPLPELDLSLLKDVDSHSQAKQKLKVKDSSSDAMET
ncbi:uncharacterized protein wu:fa19b12 [Toxotes jaculatrix]|uniref:uncharacterized protein wu:fa19b12 n=1 Tax=Toxotes jaculatrix TaxID=941984 RepID=UPI001B3AB481|nr:uncharacterized protein wu:fa19b12 [Toxotes jaculatrix]